MYDVAVRRAAKSEKGFISLEAALVYPFLLFILMLLTQLVLAVYAKRAAQAAAEQGAEHAAYFQATNLDGRLAAEDAISKIPGLKKATTTIERDDENVTVIVEGTPLKILPIPLNISARSSAPIERIIEVGERQ